MGDPQMSLAQRHARSDRIKRMSSHLHLSAYFDREIGKWTLTSEQFELLLQKAVMGGENPFAPSPQDEDDHASHG
jgi:hypothetical protein